MRILVSVSGGSFTPHSLEEVLSSYPGQLTSDKIVAAVDSGEEVTVMLKMPGGDEKKQHLTFDLPLTAAELSA